MDIKLSYNNGFCWKKNGNAYFNGYLAEISDCDVLIKLNEISDFSEFIDLVRSL